MNGSAATVQPARGLRFSANLGFLWPELPLPDRIRAAAKAGFDAVECHFPYDTAPGEVRAALDDTGLPIVSLNTSPGDLSKGDFGLAALPGRVVEARAAIDQAIAYAGAIGCPMIHVMAGNARGNEACRTFHENLSYALDQTQGHDLTILIEPINPFDVPGYFLQSLDQAVELVDALGSTRLRLMFDCYHLARMGGDLIASYHRHSDYVAHVQFAAVPDRTEPDHGDIDYTQILPDLIAAGYRGYFGAEYRPGTTTDAGLGWLRAHRPLGARRPIP